MTLLWGGFTVGNPTLNRFFSLHYLLPFVIVAVVGAHLIALHQHGSNNPLGIDRRGRRIRIPFHPYYTIKDMFGLCVFLLVFAILRVLCCRTILGSAGQLHPGEPDGNAEPHRAGMVPAAVLRDPALGHVRSESSCWGSSCRSARSSCCFWCRGSTPRRCAAPASARSIDSSPGFWWSTSIALGCVGAQPPRGLVVTVGQFATFYYFLHFLILMPLLGKIERPATAADQHRRRRAAKPARRPARRGSH